MADFADLPVLRGPSLRSSAQAVPDVLLLSLLPQDEFQPGTLTLGSVEFVAHALSGMAAAMQAVDGALRATTRVTVPLTDDAGGAETAERDVTLYGPGDVLGVDPGQIIRRYPSPGSVTAEETFHAHIEFDRPEVPWAFSAQSPDPGRHLRIRPWLALVVLERSEAGWEPITGGQLPVLVVDADRLPSVVDCWAMAHAQTTGGSASLSARLSTAFAPVNLSRLLAARVLTQQTAYVACLVPTTDAGMRAGLGIGGGTLGPAWQGGGGTVRLPVYDRWEFTTAPDGDFARLARRLQGVPAPWRVGRRIMDTARPGAPLTDLSVDEQGRRQVIRCALYSPNAPTPPDTPPDTPSDDSRWTAERTTALREALDRPAVVAGRTATDPGRPDDLPIIGPRIYAQFQRGASQVTGADWFAELNLAPVHRVAAGIGTRVVVKDQEPLMQAAWAQVGQIDEANRALRLAQLAQAVALTVHGRLGRLDSARMLSMTRPAAARVRVDGAALTLHGQVTVSATAPAVLAGAMRRLTRPTGRIARLVGAAGAAQLARIAAPDGVARDMQRPVRTPDGIGGLSAVALTALQNDATARVLGTELARVPELLATQSTVLARNPSLAGATTAPEVWGAPDRGFDVAREASERVARRVLEGAAALPESDLVGRRWFAGLAAGLADVARGPRSEQLTTLAVDVQDSIVRAVPVDVVTRRPGPVLAGPVLAGPVLAGPVLAGPVRRGPIRGGALRGGAALRRGGPVDVVRRVDLVGSYLPRRRDRNAPLSPAEKVADIKTTAGTDLAGVLVAVGRTDISSFRDVTAALIGDTGALALSRTPARPPLTTSRTDLLARLDPRRTVVDATRGRLTIGVSATSAWLVEELIRPIMAAPRFDRPMYRALDDYDQNWLIPGLGLLPGSDMVTVLEANDTFTEAFLIGLSDEMGRELLWRGYPTDQRGTCFRRFWDGSKDELVAQIHRFERTPLGSHLTVGPQGQSGRAVVVIRGEIVRRYPDLTVMALKGQPGPTGAMADDQGRPFLPEAPTDRDHAVPTIFTGFLDPDIMVAGLDITVTDLRAGGWWIVLAQHPQAPRFRRKETDLVAHESAFADVSAYDHGATVAADRLENPVRVAFEAGDFLPTA